MERVHTCGRAKDMGPLEWNSETVLKYIYVKVRECPDYVVGECAARPVR
jgi:hypothetical protein